MELTTKNGTCSLCNLRIQKKSIADGEREFCCHGCHAVFRILEAKGSRSFCDEPIFQEAVRSGLISNPALLEEMRKRQKDSREKRVLYLEIDEMWCPSCAEVIALVLEQKEGILSCGIDYATDLGKIEYDPIKTSVERILESIRKLGYRPSEFGEKEEARNPLTLRLIVATFCSLNLMMLSYPVYASYYFPIDVGTRFAFLALGFALPTLFYSAAPIFRRFWQGLKVGIVGMEALISIGVGSAFILSLFEVWRGTDHIYLDSMGVIIAFVLLGKKIEERAKFSAKNSLFRLGRSLPRKARRKGGQIVPAKEMEVGEVVLVLPGERFVLDGVVVQGEGGVDESSITGESIPIYKQIGSEIASGSLLQNGWVEVQVTKTLRESGLSHMIEILEKELGRKTKQEAMTDRVARGFVCTSLLLALVALPWKGFSTSLSVLLIACPCAVGIAAPLVESRLLAALSALGAVVRNRSVLPLLGTETATVFDKTGTLTIGKFQVLDLPKTELSILKGMAAKSNHPIARAIVEAIQGEVSLDVFEVHGKGLVSGEYRLGSKGWMEELGIAVPSQEKTASYFAKGKQLIGVVLLGDKTRESSQEVVNAAPHPSLVSGDTEPVVRAMAEALSIREWRGGVLPLEKKEWVEELKKRGERVLFIGDGINDAPAIAAADIGIAMNGASDLAAHVADITLQTEDLRVLQEIRKLGKRGRRLIAQNLFWAFVYNTFGIGLALMGLLSPIFSAGAMVASSLSVIWNSSRLRS